MVLPVTLRFTIEDPRLMELCERYWEINDELNFKSRVSDLAREFGIPSNQLSRLVSESAAAFSMGDACSVCQTPWMFTSRTEWQQRRNTRFEWKCSACRRTEQEARDAERLRAEEEYREKIRQNFPAENPGPLDPLELSLEEAVYLTAVTRLLAVEDFSFARSLDSARARLSPTDDLDLDILKALFHKGLLAVDPSSRMGAFVSDSPGRFYLDKVQWLLPVCLTSDDPKDFASELEELLRSTPWPTHWLNARLGLWRTVALNECLQYLTVALAEHSFALNPGEKTLLVLGALLESYSVGQIYNMIWRAAKDAAAFYLRNNASKQHAANTVIGSIQRYGERAKAEGWEVKAYRRNFECPQSMVSDVLFNAALQIGEDGFKKVPNVGRLIVLQVPCGTATHDESASADKL